MSLSDFAVLARPFNCLMAAIGTFIGYCIALDLIAFDGGIAVAMAVAFLVCAGGMVANDFFDLRVDRKLRPKKPLPSGRVSPRAALAFCGFLFLAGNALALFFLPLISLLISLAFTFLLVSYSGFLARAKYLGNWVVASGTAFTLVFGASLAGNYDVVIFFAFAALFANLARELEKDLEDVRADRGFKKSLPMVLGKKSVAWIVLLCYVIAVPAAFLPAFLFSFDGFAFIALVSAASFFFLYGAAKTFGRDYGEAQRVSKYAMLLALLGFLLGVA